MKCPRCQHENRSQAKFCEECASPLNPANPTAQPGADPKSEVEDFERALSEALEQQTATAEILRVIASSPTDVQPVFAAVLMSAARLCEALDVSIFQVDGDGLRLVAHEGPILSHPVGGFPLIRGMTVGRSVLDRRTIHVPDVQAEVDEYPDASSFARSFGFRTVLSVPLLCGTEAIGAIAIRRTEVRPFTDRHIELLQTFAAQAVIAIENVRLFTETKETLEQQTATSEILRVISSSPTDLQPVMDVVADSAARFCGAINAAIWQLEGEVLRLVAAHGPQPTFWPLGTTIAASTRTVGGRAIRDRRTIHIEDFQALPEIEFPETAERDRRNATPARTMLVTPLMREGVAIGTIYMRRDQVQPFTAKQIELAKTFAAQAVIAIENVRLFTELQEKNRALTAAHAQISETLEQRTATAEILQVISRSPTDVQPVFDTIVRSAVPLCDAVRSNVQLFDGELMHWVAQHNVRSEAMDLIHRLYPMQPDRSQTASRAVLTRSVVHLPDVLDDHEYRRELALSGGWRSMLSVPMIRAGDPIGAITVVKDEPGRFSETQIALLQTFADQAVIAIENVRLFQELGARNRELTEALEQQTATAEILRVISGSPTDLAPVFESILANATRLCEANLGTLFRYDGEAFEAVAVSGAAPAWAEYLRRGRIQPGPRTALARVLQDLLPVHIVDITSEPAYEERDPLRVASVELERIRTLLQVPLLRDGALVGVLAIYRREIRPFTDTQIRLLKTFADQAVIAIENVRLFTELEARNRELTQALKQQTATGEILRVISSSPTDVQPVFKAIVRSAVPLCEAAHGTLFRFDGSLVHLVAHHGLTPEALDANLRVFPRPPGRGSVAARAILTRDVVHVDIAEDPEHEHRGFVLAGFRTVLSVPMLREGKAIGTITVTRGESRPFTDTQIALLQTFAEQAVIAIENVRLFKELEARTQDLTRSVGELRALGDVGRALSATLDLDTVLQTIVTRASQLAGTDACSVFEYDETTEAFLLRATHNLDDEVVAVARRTPIRKGEGIQGRMAVTRQPVQIPDIAAEDAYRGPLRDILLRTGTRALLAIPMLREDELIGGFTVNKKTPGAFAPKVIELLQTFATQSALAIQNARLFREIADKGRQLEAASRHKSEFLANMSHELRTPLNAILGFSEVLAERMFGEVNDKQAEYLQDILSSGRHLLSLINDILDLSKVEAGRLELELGRFHLPTALDNALTLVRERATRHGITLTETVDEGVGHIVADERKVKQILLNLLSNAVKFTPEGGRVGLTATGADDVITVAVSDTGVGIAPEDQAAIFEEFRQVGRDDTRKQEGTGLGLTLAKKFVDLHGGRIWVESQVGQGSTFSFTLPVRLDESGASDQGGGEPPRP